jgi:hypothetical protein
MKNYIIFNPTTGDIEISGTCQDSDFEYQGTPETRLELDASVNGSTHYIVDGAPVAYTEGQRVARATLPTHQAKWSNETMSWLDLRPLADIKDARWEEMKVARTEAKFAPITVDGRCYDANETSQSQISGAIQLSMFAPSDWTIDWTLFDNTVATLTKPELIAVGVALGTRTSAIWTTGRTVREAIYACTTAEEVAAVVWQ